MSASLKPLTLDEFLAWERTQPVRYEFDGMQPVAMTGGTIAADRVARRLLRALDGRLMPPCEAFGENAKVLTPAGRVRYPDVKVARQCFPAGLTEQTGRRSLAVEGGEGGRASGV